MATSPTAILRGLGVRDDLSKDLLPKLTFSPTIGITTSRVDKLGLDIRSFKVPLTRAIQKVIIPSIQTNFDVGGRPEWEPLSDVTLLIRASAGYGGSAPLIRTGALKRTMGYLNIWDINQNSAILGNLPSKVWYGAIHQAGFGSGGPSAGGFSAFVKKGGAKQKASTKRSVYIPQRQFVLLQPRDLEAIDGVFTEWLEERIAKTWGSL